MKTVSLKNICLKIAFSALVLGVSGQSGYSMEADHRSLDSTWTKYGSGAPNLMDVIGMSNRKKNKYEECSVRIGVAVLDDYINPMLCDLSPDSEKAPYKYDFVKNDHGSHVANTLRKICPSALIHNNIGNGPNKNLIQSLMNLTKNPNIDIINLSIGPSDCNDVSDWIAGGDIYKALVQAVEAGKIIVKTFGNDKQNLSNKEHKKYCNTFTTLSEDTKMKGLIVLVANSEYSKNTDLLSACSNYPYEACKYAITGPGTDITALTNIDAYKTYSGTSMAAPIVSGIIAQLLYDFREHRKIFGEMDLGSDILYKSIILKGLFESARTTGLDGKTLDIKFGRGIINYQKAHEAIDAHLRNKINSKFSDFDNHEAKRREEKQLEAKRQRAADETGNEVSLIQYLISNEPRIRDMSKDAQYTWLLKRGGLSEGAIVTALFG